MAEQSLLLLFLNVRQTVIPDLELIFKINVLVSVF
ncbi:hypothetical protein FIV04_20215 (plasmid) [Vibrio sp. THAF190c]|nr:hypothetical protein FIV04_20215 [Vibrio sp. THAF190c]